MGTEALRNPCSFRRGSCRKKKWVHPPHAYAQERKIQWPLDLTNLIPSWMYYRGCGTVPIALFQLRYVTKGDAIHRYVA